MRYALVEVRHAGFRLGAFALATSVAACSLLVDTGDLSGGAAPPDAAPGVEAGAEPLPGDAAADGYAPDAATDAATDAAHPYVAAVTSDAPVLYLRLEEDAGAIAHDLGGKPAATLEGNAALGAAGAFPGSRAVALDGGAGGIRAFGEVALGATSPYSLEAWFLPMAYDDEYRFVVNVDAVSNDGGRQTTGIWAQAGFDVLEFERYIDNEKRQVVSKLPSTGAYHHVVAVYDGALLRLYLDGVLVAATGDTRAGHAVGDLWFGAFNEGYGAVIGTVDEVAFYDKALTAERVRAHYEAAISLR